LCSLSFAFAPTLMQVIDGKVILANSRNVAVAHFDKQNADEDVSLLVVNPGEEDIVPTTIKPGSF
jgi:hypothetical protein